MKDDDNTGGLGVVGSNPAAPTTKALENLADFALTGKEPQGENGTESAQNSRSGAQSPEIIPNEPEIEFRAGRPPNFEAIARVFPWARKPGTIFTYGHLIYVSDDKPLPRSLIAHETIHVQQQFLMGRDEWWDRYLADAKFRLGQETAAHRIELAVRGTEGNRHMRRIAAVQIAKRLSGPLYGRMCSLAHAKKLLAQ